MTLALYNTLTRRVEVFQPLIPTRVTLYTCGPTVWNYAHIGNFRTFLFEDLLRRHLESSGYAVFHIMNLTDVDDRTIKAAAAAGKRLEEYTAPFIAAFYEDRDYLRMRPAHAYPRATQSVAPMVALVQRLLERGMAYTGEDGSVYFAISKFPAYGRLSRLDQRQIKVGARVASDEYAKDDPRDFALWKHAQPVDEQVGAAWDAPFGRGRPGWHLECSAMSLEAIGPEVQTLDIHAGGVDLIFPHHEDEIAQSEAATGCTFVRYWLHGEFLNVRGTKMSKRFGNFLTARDMRDQGVDAAAVRLLFWQTHYRQPLDFTDAALEAATEGVKRLGEFHERLSGAAAHGRGNGSGPLAAFGAQFLAEVGAALDDDLNAPRACAAVFEFVRAANRELDRGAGGAAAARDALDRAMQVLDILPTPKSLTPELAQWITARIAARAKARQAKDFKEADRLRAELRDRGVDIEDTAAGTKWRLT